MGLFSKSILILFVAISTPLIYRQYANEQTVKFMSNYYSNYNVIDQFLRQSAGQIERVKEYLPDRKQIESIADSLKTQLDSVVKVSKQKFDNFKQAQSQAGASNKQQNEKLNNNQASSKQNIKKQTTADKASERPVVADSENSIRMCKCPNEKNSEQIRLWSKDELAKFDGSSGSEIYLAFLGIVYNVTINAQHYGPGAEYSAFSGLDATRAFVTGNFSHDLNDDISDLDQSLYSHIESWASFYSSSYSALGRIEGAFFDSRGCGTAELGRVYEIFSKMAEDRAKYQAESKQLPECNSEWNAELASGRVWCSKQSGGTERDWVGVPRQLIDGKDKRCVCVNLEAYEQDELARFKLYSGCDASASECILKQ